jgi:glucokinase
VLPVLREGGFVRAFNAKGRLAPMIETIPVRVVLDPQTALWGAATLALAPG